MPKFGRWAEAKAFLDRHTPWLAERLESSVKPVAFVRGAIVPLRGVNHRIVPTGRVRGVVEVGEHEGERALLVPGEPAHRARRLIDWLKAEALKDLERRCRLHAAVLGVNVKSISMRSQSRAGSGSPDSSSLSPSRNRKPSSVSVREKLSVSTMARSPWLRVRKTANDTPSTWPAPASCAAPMRRKEPRSKLSWRGASASCRTGQSMTWGSGVSIRIRRTPRTAASADRCSSTAPPAVTCHGAV